MEFPTSDEPRVTPNTDRTEEGFALAAAIFALVVVGALVTGGFFAASQEHRAGDSSRYTTEAFYTAEQGIADVIGTKNRAWFETIPLYGYTDPDTVVLYHGGKAVGRYITRVFRTGQRLYFVQSTGEVLRGGIYSGATRSLGLMARAMSVDVPSDRALQVFGQLRIGGNSRVDGNDLPPANWDDCDNIGAVNGVVARDTSVVTTFGNGKLFGNPPKAQNPGLGVDDFLQLGDFTFDELAAMAEKVYPPGAVANNMQPVKDASGNCAIGELRNWGAPLDRNHPCHTYFPIIYGQGDLTLNANANGQGILLVEGDLHLTGGFLFYGIVIVKGKFESTGTDGHINGTALVYGDGEINVQNQAQGNSVVQFSSCAINRAITMNQWASRVVPLRQRGWMDLTGAGVAL